MSEPTGDSPTGADLPYPSRAARHQQEQESGGTTPAPQDSVPEVPAPSSDAQAGSSPAVKRTSIVSGQQPEGKSGVQWASPAASVAPAAVLPNEEFSRTAGLEVEADEKKKGSWWKRTVLGLFLVFLLGIIAFAGLFLFAYQKAKIPPPNDFALAETTVIYYEDGETELGRFSEVNRTVIDIEELPQWVTHAVVASEDRTFYTNAGVDLKGIARALVNNLRGGPRQGASTLSQIGRASCRERV